MGADKLESLLFQLFEREVQISLPLLHMGLDLLLSENRSACLQTPVIVPGQANVMCESIMLFPWHITSLRRAYVRDVLATQLPQRSRVYSPSLLNSGAFSPAVVTLMKCYWIAAGSLDSSEVGGANRPACCIPERDLAKDCHTEQIWTACSVVGAAEPVQDQRSGSVEPQYL